MENRPLLFFVDPAWRRKDIQHIPLMFPFWGNAFDPERLHYQHAIFERHGFNTSYYGITENLDEADLILMPYGHAFVLRYYPELLSLVRAVSITSGKTILIDGVGDIERPIALPNTLVLRYGGYRFKNQGNEIIVPPYSEDLLEVYQDGKLSIRKKSVPPSVGFTGWGTLTFAQEVRARLKEIPTRIRALWDSRYGSCRKGVFFRREAISVLMKSPLITPHVKVRTSYSGNAKTVSGSTDDLRREFVETLLESDYGLDVRGDANASTRLFEMLSLGCIPVIVDTERNFPLSSILKYEEFALVVDFRKTKQLPELIAAFHARTSEEAFEAMQRRAREVYENYFRLDAFTNYLMREIREKAVSVAD